MSSMNGATRSYSKKGKEKAEVQLSSIVIYSEQPKIERQPMSSMNGATTSHSKKGKEKAAVVPEVGLPEVITFTSRRIKEKMENNEKIRNFDFFSPTRLPYTIRGICSRNVEPEIVSIGPLYRKKSDHLLRFEEYKWFFLAKFLRRCGRGRRDLERLLLEMQSLEARTRNFYSDHEGISEMPSQDLIQLMLLDGSFLIELLCYPGRDESLEVPGDLILVRPLLIPVLARDVLRLRNQLPLFVLTSLFGQSKEKFMKLALEFFNLSWRGPQMSLPSELPDCSHLLELFYWSSVKPLSVNHGDDRTYAPTHSMQCVRELKSSGIKFMGREEAKTFLNIKYKNRILQIPATTFDELMNTVLINCVALEQSRERHIKYFCNYVSFFSCLISQPRDVSSLSFDGIISKFSDDDRYIADFFKDLGRNTQGVRSSYLSDEINNIETYYNSDWASLMRNHFTNKWKALQVLVSSLFLVLTFIQVLMSVLSYIHDLK
ncbi:UPF0481 protein At3g47200-like [Mangifera indica]|uniref:UPF0481 protein At3g47200-like n=1 Tax=Mangifera indica TaxID=29780 RepID=UPI001CFC0CE2|nr:UPF0481 protein At3g47200-like [Mangifera indica]